MLYDLFIFCITLLDTEDHRPETGIGGDGCDRYLARNSERMRGDARFCVLYDEYEFITFFL